ESQEPVNQAKTGFDVATAAPIGKREFGAWWTADEHIYRPELFRIEGQDVAVDRLRLGMVLLVGEDGGGPIVQGRYDMEACLPEALGESARTTKQVCAGEPHSESTPIDAYAK